MPVRLSFKASLLPTLLALLATLTLTRLGFWQLDRAGQKQAMQDQFQERSAMAELDLTALIPLPASDILWRRVRIAGSYHERWRILLDNQTYQGQAGYAVYTPLRLASNGPWVLIDRGWIPAPAYRNIIPVIATPADQVTVFGRIEQPPFSGILLSNDFIETLDQNILRTQAVRPDKLEEMTGIKFLPFIVVLSPESATAFLRDRPTPGFGKERHLGYAFQWFAMATAVVCIYLYLQIKNLRHG